MKQHVDVISVTGLCLGFFFAFSGGILWCWRRFFIGPWYVATSGMGAGCSRVVCMVFRLSIPPSGTYIYLTKMRASFNLRIRPHEEGEILVWFLGTPHVVIGSLGRVPEGVWAGWWGVDWDLSVLCAATFAGVCSCSSLGCFAWLRVLLGRTE